MTDACQTNRYSIFYKWLKSAQFTLLGPHCLLCRAPAPLSRALCDGCLADLPWLGQSCRHCALALPEDSRVDCCATCRARPRFDRAVSVFAYREPVRWLIGELKFRGRLAHARLLGDLLGKQLHETIDTRPDLLLPVPLHRQSFRRRGFNQAERIATRLAGVLDRPVAANVLVRTRATARQSTLAVDARRANIRDAFAVRAPVAGRHVAIVDDVVTTTHTAAAIADALRRAGAARIDVYSVARA